ncbi:peptidylprolyl isomerase [Candidatus Sumerlaeota bacterium]|nr:peptidylprolyl isomerase [Candidatus Sumerlaeota bacterium]
MVRWKKLLLLIATLAASICSAAAHDPDALHDPQGRAQVVAVVNRRVITAGDLDLYVLDYRMRRARAWDEPIEKLRRQIVTTAVDDLLLGGWADIQMENQIPPAMIEASFRNSWNDRENIAGGAERLRDMIADSRLTEDQVRDWYKRKALENLTIREVIVSRADLGGKNPFDAKVADAVRLKVAQILIHVSKSEEDALGRALLIRRDVEAGLAFERAARLYSDDGASALDGGELGWFDAGELHPDLWNAAKKVVPGSCTEPVRTKAGYHLMRVLDFETPQQIDYLRIVEEEEQKQLRELRDKSDILCAEGYELLPLGSDVEESAAGDKYREPIPQQ